MQIQTYYCYDLIKKEFYDFIDDSVNSIKFTKFLDQNSQNIIYYLDKLYLIEIINKFKI